MLIEFSFFFFWPLFFLFFFYLLLLLINTTPNMQTTESFQIHFSEHSNLLTNEYAWVNRLTHPKYQRIRTYRVHIEGPVKMSALKELAAGVYIEHDDDKKKEKKKKTQPAFIEILREECVKIQDKMKKVSVLNISIKEGRNRQIRKMFEQINQPVIKIKRSAFENITLKDIFFPKQYRELTQKEVSNLKTRNF
ncbi:pseudouridine synthase, putative [Plasmodium malariae]|uniref:Pseudouridine synthase, putative n=1 Tax=Plasmodium malariae TaxID=5858 RepID=A0A1C3KAD8_PLAMA|nr:pseudouridine synthase, putative [Plasmodium malariae]